jgi:putative nucleotidyltransferase with HDIG domain
MDVQALTRDILGRVQGRDLQIPPYPAVSARLGALLATEKYTLRDVKTVVQVDQALVADILRVASSAAYAATPLGSLEAALSRLGIEEVRRVATARTVGAWSTKDGPLATVRRAVWRDSVIAAVVCQQLAQKRRVDADAAFLGGLLHDLGKLVALACAEQLLAANPAHGVQLDVPGWLAVVEGAHILAGLEIAARWKLPPIVVAAIESHHDVSRCPAPMRAVVDLVRIADAVLALLESKPAVDAKDLDAIPELRPEERELLVRLLPRVGEMVSTFSTPPGKQTTTQAPPVKQTQSALRDPRYAMRFPVARTTKDTVEVLESLEIAPDGLALRSAKALPENFLVRLELNAPGQSFEIWANVVANAQEPGGFRVEVRCFAQSAEGRDSWMKLFAAARAATPSAA